MVKHSKYWWVNPLVVSRHMRADPSLIQQQLNLHNERSVAITCQMQSLQKCQSIQNIGECIHLLYLDQTKYGWVHSLVVSRWNRADPKHHWKTNKTLLLLKRCGSICTKTVYWHHGPWMKNWIDWNNTNLYSCLLGICKPNHINMDLMSNQNKLTAIHKLSKGLSIVKTFRRTWVVPSSVERCLLWMKANSSLCYGIIKLDHVNTQSWAWS